MSQRDKLEKLKIIKKDSIKINNNNYDYDEVTVTIRRNERGFGFEVTQGIYITRVNSNSPAEIAGILKDDVIKKVNGTCITDKSPEEITRMISESTSFVSLTLQRKVNKKTAKDKSSNDSLNHTVDKLENINYHHNDSFNDLHNNSQKIINSDESLQRIENDVIEISLERSNSAKHRKQSSIGDDNSFKIDSIASSNRESHRRKAIKKARSTTSTKSFQTQSLTNLVATVDRSISDHELDNQKYNNEDDLLIAYTDDVSYTSEDNLAEPEKKTRLNNTLSSSLNSVLTITNEKTNEKHPYSFSFFQSRKNRHATTSVSLKNKPPSSFDLSDFNDYAQLITKPYNVAVFLNYLLSDTSETPKHLYFILITDDFITQNEKKETVHRWAIEIYSTFLMHHSPLQIDISGDLLKKIEDNLEKLPTNDNLQQLKRYFDEARSENIKIINKQLHKYREVNHLGLANLFQGGSDIFRLSQSVDQQNIFSIFEIFQNYLNKTVANYINIQDWNDIQKPDAQTSALISCFVTYLKRFSTANMKNYIKIDFDKIPVFNSKKIKLKKNPPENTRGHSFIEMQLPIKCYCVKCNLPFWGIGISGLTCQKSKCEIKVHRNCLATGLTNDCHGVLKTNMKTEYKDKIDTIKKIFSKNRAKEEDSSPSFYVPIPMSIQNNSTPTNNHVVDSGLSNGELKGQNYDALNGLLTTIPVQVAIQKFNDLSNQSKDRDNLSKGSSPNNFKKTININENLNLNNTAAESFKDKISTIIPNIYNGHYQQNTNNHVIKHSVSTNNATMNADNTAQVTCKRVGSFKADTRKKSNISRSKSDPEPDDIRHALIPTSSIGNGSLSRESSFMSNSTNTTIVSDLISLNTLNMSHSISQTQMPNSQSASTISYRRHSWLTDSDLETLEQDADKDDHRQLNNLDKKDRHAQRTMIEFIQTERRHVKKLKVLKYLYKIPISKETFLSNDEIELVFRNLEEILELHLNLKNRLRDISKQHPNVIPIQEFSNVILDVFANENGKKFEQTCSKFLEDDKYVGSYLNDRLKNVNEKFSDYLARAVTDPVSQKMGFKELFSIQFQRITKYPLMIKQLLSTVQNEKDTQIVQKCLDETSRFISNVNEAVRKSENKRRITEIQHKLDTSIFDAYSTKSTYLSNYKNLDITNRVLIDELTVECRTGREINPTYLLLVFEDILVFLDTNIKDTFVLKPIAWYSNKVKHLFSPVISLQWIVSLKPMPDKRGFHMVALMGDKNKNKQVQQQKVEKIVETQMLFLLNAQSNDIRTRFLDCLQILTGKVTSNIHTTDIQQPINTNVNINSNNNNNNKDLVNDIVTTPVLIPKTDVVKLEDNNEHLKHELESNLLDVQNALKRRSELLDKLLKTKKPDVSNGTPNKTQNNIKINTYFNECQTILNNLAQNIIKETNQQFEFKILNQIITLQENLTKIEETLNEDGDVKIPQLSFTKEPITPNSAVSNDHNLPNLSDVIESIDLMKHDDYDEFVSHDEESYTLQLPTQTSRRLSDMTVVYDNNEDDDEKKIEIHHNNESIEDNDNDDGASYYESTRTSLQEQNSEKDETCTDDLNNVYLNLLNKNDRIKQEDEETVSTSRKESMTNDSSDEDEVTNYVDLSDNLVEHLLKSESVFLLLEQKAAFLNSNRTNSKQHGLPIS